MSFIKFTTISVLTNLIICSFCYPGLENKHVDEQVQDTDIVLRQKRAATALVDVTKFTYNVTGGKIQVYADDTMSRMIVTVTVYKSRPIIMATTPIGVPYAKHPVIVGNERTGDGKVVATLNISLSATDYGKWNFQKLDGALWEVKIQAESPVSIKQELFELSTNTPISGHPTVGSEYKLVITVTGYSSVQSVDQGFLYPITNMIPIGMAPLISIGNGIYEAAKVKMPNQIFMVGIQGKDNSNHTLRRVDANEIIPTTLDLSVPAYTGVTITEYSTFTISFVVTNLINTAQDTDIRIDDGGRGFVQPPKFLGPTLKVGENYTGNFTLKVSFPGLPLSVKITAREYVAGGPKLETPSIVEERNFTVVSSTTSASTISTKKRSTTAVSNTGHSPLSTSKSPAVGQSTGNLGGHVTGTTKRIPSSNVPGGNKSQQNMQSSTLSNPHSGGQTFDHSEESKGAANDDKGSRMGVPATVALSVSGFISGTLVGIGVVAGAIAIHKKMKNKKVSADDSKDLSMNDSNKTFTKERTSSKSMVWH